MLDCNVIQHNMIESRIGDTGDTIKVKDWHGVHGIILKRDENWFRYHNKILVLKNSLRTHVSDKEIVFAKILLLEKSYEN